MFGQLEVFGEKLRYLSTFLTSEFLVLKDPCHICHS